MLNLINELSFQTTRSGGKGGQNVNKVETAVIGTFSIPDSKILTEDQKTLLKEKLKHRLTLEDKLIVRSQIHRSQLANKEEVIKKIYEIISKALEKKKARIATRVSKASKERRLESKKRKAEIKEGRRKVI